MTEQLLLVEDDRELGAQIVRRLERAGFLVRWWTEGKTIDQDVLNGIRVVVLDLMLPGMHGLDLLKSLRLISDVPVLVLSARQEGNDKVRALKLGADDYMTKPFWPEELVERVRARLRRPTLQRRGPVVAGPVTIDPARREVRIDGKLLELTPTELELLLALARAPGEAVTRQWLLSNVLDPEREATERTLDVHCSRLRKKLGYPELIETVWGIGYRLRPGDS
jgi:DNA-binding response OmpR family regulator